MIALEQFWTECVKILLEREILNPFQLSMLTRASVDEVNDLWRIYVPNPLFLDMMKQAVYPHIEKIKQEIAPDTPELEITIGKGRFFASITPPTKEPKSHPQKNVKSEEATKTIEPTPNTDLPTVKITVEPDEPSELDRINRPTHQELNYESTKLSKELTFETLVEGKGNQFAVAAAKAVVEEPGKRDYNPFFIYGCSGMGKTHLVQAVANRIFQRNPTTRVRYVHADKFFQDYMKAVRKKNWDDFKNYYRNLDLLILDDVHLIAGRDKTMEEFFYLFNQFLELGKQVILTSDRMPKDFDKENPDSERIRSRLAWGLTVEVEPPEFEMRLAILNKKAQVANIKLPEDVAFLIAQNVYGNVRELEGALKNIIARHNFNGQEITVPFVKETLKDIFASSQKQITVEHIQKIVADYYHIKVTDILGKLRRSHIVRSRQIAMWLAKKLTDLSSTQIGDGFNRHHSTILHASDKIEKDRQNNAELDEDLEKLINMLKN